MFGHWRVGRTTYWAFVVALLAGQGMSRLLAGGSYMLEDEAGIRPWQVIDLMFLLPWLLLISCRLRDLGINRVWALAYIPFSLAASFVAPLVLLATAFACIFILGAGAAPGPED